MSLKEIAQLTGYSVSTISRVLNGKQKCASAKVESEIWKAAQKLHYNRNYEAANLKTGKSNRGRVAYQIGIIMARGLESLDDDFYFQIENSAKTTVLRAGHRLGETFMLRAVLDNPQYLSDIDGLVLLGKCKAHNLELLQSICGNLVCTGLNPYHMEIDQLYCNGERIARAAVRYFVLKGYKKIGYIGECNGDVRYLGYQQALMDAGLDTSNPYVFEVSQTKEGGREAARQYIISEDPPTAIFCVNDVCAIGFIEAFRQFKPGEPLPKVIGAGDISSALPMGLTTIQVPLQEMGNMAARLLLDRLTRGHSIPVKIELPYKIICRQTA